MDLKQASNRRALQILNEKNEAQNRALDVLDNALQVAFRECAVKFFGRDARLDRSPNKMTMQNGAIRMPVTGATGHFFCRWRAQTGYVDIRIDEKDKMTAEVRRIGIHHADCAVAVIDGAPKTQETLECELVSAFAKRLLLKPAPRIFTP